MGPAALRGAGNPCPRPVQLRCGGSGALRRRHPGPQPIRSCTEAQATPAPPPPGQPLPRPRNHSHKADHALAQGLLGTPPTWAHSSGRPPPHCTETQGHSGRGQQLQVASCQSSPGGGVPWPRLRCLGHAERHSCPGGQPGTGIPTPEADKRARPGRARPSRDPVRPFMAWNACPGLSWAGGEGGSQGARAALARVPGECLGWWQPTCRSSSHPCWTHRKGPVNSDHTYLPIVPPLAPQGRPRAHLGRGRGVALPADSPCRDRPRDQPGTSPVPCLPLWGQAPSCLAEGRRHWHSSSFQECPEPLPTHTTPWMGSPRAFSPAAAGYLRLRLPTCSAAHPTPLA